MLFRIIVVHIDKGVNLSYYHKTVLCFLSTMSIEMSGIIWYTIGEKYWNFE